MRKRYVTTVIVGVLGIAAAICTVCVLIWNGVILLNDPSVEDYPVRGVDVSSYQGDIDWKTLSSQGIAFAFIKATEGSSFVDEYFAYNYEQAQKTGICVGAYHFFSYDSQGLTQAENHIKTVAPFEGMLPPVVDLEFYGDKEKDPPPKDEVDVQLGAMLEALEAYYGLKPIIYATERSYELYLAGDYEAYDIWIRSIVTEPRLPDDRDWTFWQFTNRERLDGYAGKETYIDMNVFHGSEEAFAAYPKYTAE